MLFFLKSIMSSDVFVVLRMRLLTEHHSDRFWTSCLEADSSPPVISTTTLVSSANLITELDGNVGEQRCIMNIGGDSAHSPEVSRC